MANKYVDAINTLWLTARWWMTFLHLTWIIGGVVDLISDFSMGITYIWQGKEAYGYYTLGVALTAGVLNIFVVLFGIRRVPILSGGKAKEKTAIVLPPIWHVILKYATLLFTICFLGSPFLYVVMMIDLSKDFVDEPSAKILSQTLWITAIVELLIEQVPQALLQFFIIGNENKVSPQQLFTTLTSTIGAACTFAGFIDTLAKDKYGFFHLLTGRGLNEREKEHRQRKLDEKRKGKPKDKLDVIVTVKENNSPGYNSLVFLGLLVFLYELPVALLSAQFDLPLFAMLLIHGFPVLFMLASKLFGMKYKEWIYTSLALTFASVVVVITIWYGTVTHGWLGGNKFARMTNGTNITTRADEPDLKGLLPDDRGITATIAQIGHLWSGTLTTFTGSCIFFFVFFVAFSAFCFILGVLTSSFTPLPCCEVADADAKENADESEMVPIKVDENYGKTPVPEPQEMTVEQNLTELRSELTSLKNRMELVELQIKEQLDRREAVA